MWEADQGPNAGPALTNISNWKEDYSVAGTLLDMSIVSSSLASVV